MSIHEEVRQATIDALTDLKSGNEFILGYTLILDTIIEHIKKLPLNNIAIK